MSSKVLVYSHSAAGKDDYYERGGLRFDPGVPTQVDDPLLVEFLLSTRKFKEVGLRGEEIGAEESLDSSDPFSGMFTHVANAPIHAMKDTLADDDLNGKRVLLKRLGGIGDLVFVAVTAQHIRDKYPEVHLAIAVRDIQVMFAETFAVFDEVFDIQDAGRMPVFQNYDYIIHFNGVIEGDMSTGTAPKDDKDYYEAYFERVGWKDKAPAEKHIPLAAKFSYDNQAATTTILQRAGIGNEPYAVVIAGSSNPLKVLHIRVLERIITGLATGDPENPDAPRMRVVVIGGGRDRVPDATGNSWITTIHGERLEVSAELVARATCVFGSDTGLVQYAAALGVPTVSYWGPTKPEFSIVHAPGHREYVMSTMECAPCLHVRAAYCPYFKSNMPDCMRQVDHEAIIGDMQSVYLEAIKGSDDREREARLESMLGQQTFQPRELSEVFDSKQYNVAILLDNADRFTGGGFYLWTMGRILAQRPGVNVYMICDAQPPVYIRGEVRLPGFRIIANPDLEHIDEQVARKAFDLIIAGPPTLGTSALHMKASSEDFSKETKVALVVYETPNYIAAYRPGTDAEEDYWASYKHALICADVVIPISSIVKDNLLEWLPELDAPYRVRVIAPSVRDDVADAVLGREVSERLHGHRDNSIVMIGRNMQYKDLLETATLIGDEVAPVHGTKDDPLVLHIIGDGVGGLLRGMKPSTEQFTYEFHDSISEVKKWELIKRAKCLVHPSLFEGFGIPIAEAMYACTPVVARPLEVFKRCFKDHPFYYVPGEEGEHGLAGVINALFAGWVNQPDVTKKYMREGWRFIRRAYTMARGNTRVGEYLKTVASERLAEGEAHEVETVRTGDPNLRLAIVSSWGNRCGIAETTKTWLDTAKFTYRVFAPNENSSALVTPDDARVVRCWDRDFRSMGGLLSELEGFAPDIVHFQHEHSFFTRNEAAEKCFFDLLARLRELGIKTVVTLHTYDTSSFVDRLKESVDAIVVTKAQVDLEDHLFHTIDLPTMKAHRIGNDTAKEELGWNDRPRYVVGSFGMWADHKGYDEFIQTYNDVSLRMSGNPLRYMICGYRAPNNTYAQHVIRKHTDMRDNASLALFSDYDPMPQVIRRLCAANALVFNYAIMSHSSASAAIRIGMSVGRPIVCTYSSMFDELEHEKHVLKVKHGEHADLVNAILRVREDRDLCHTLVSNCDTFIQDQNPPKIAAAHAALYAKLVPAK